LMHSPQETLELTPGLSRAAPQLPPRGALRHRTQQAGTLTLHAMAVIGLIPLRAGPTLTTSVAEIGIGARARFLRREARLPRGTTRMGRDTWISRDAVPGLIRLCRTGTGRPWTSAAMSLNRRWREAAITGGARLTLRPGGIPARPLRCLDTTSTLGLTTS
jgi:hypothetical protein